MCDYLHAHINNHLNIHLNVYLNAHYTGYLNKSHTLIFKLEHNEELHQKIYQYLDKIYEIRGVKTPRPP